MTDLPKGMPILCVDFDGVIHSYASGWKGARIIPDPAVPGAMEFLEEAIKHFDVCIYSSRSRYFGGRRAMKAWLLSQFERHFYKNADAASERGCTILSKLIISKLSFPTRKPPAFLQIDDRAMCFTGTFPSIVAIKAFKPWNKKW